MANYTTSQRQFQSGGSPYPTGRSPIVLGLEDSIASVTQDLVKARKEEIKAQRLEVDENEKLLLDALDLEPIEGMSDKVASDFVAGVDSLSDKYSRLLMERGGIFSREDKLNLAKEKRQLEKKLTIASSDIATLKQLKMEVAKTQDKSYVDNMETSKNIVDFEKKGLVGTGGAINLAVLKQQPFGEDWVAEIAPSAEKMLFSDKAFSVAAEVINRSTGEVKNSYDNSQAVGNYMQYAKQLPSYQRMYAQDPVRAEAFANAVAQRWTMKPVQTDFETAVKPRATGGGGGSRSAAPSQISAKYNWNLPDDQAETIESFHTTAEGIRKGDMSSLDRIMGTGDGQINNAEYFVEGGVPYVKLYVNPSKYGGKVLPAKTEILKIPSMGDETGAKTFYSKLYNYYPPEFKKGLEKLNIANYLTPSQFESGEFSAPPPNRDWVNIVESASKINSSSGGNMKNDLDSLISMVNKFSHGQKLSRLDKKSKVKLGNVEYDLKTQYDDFIQAVTTSTSSRYVTSDGSIVEVPMSDLIEFLYLYPGSKKSK